MTALNLARADKSLENSNCDPCPVAAVIVPSLHDMLRGIICSDMLLCTLLLRLVLTLPTSR